MNAPESEPQASKWRKHLLWQLPVFALVCYLGFFASSNFDEELNKYMPETVANASTHNAQGSGYRAFYELCKRVGLDCDRFESSYRDLGAKKAVLVLVAPSFPLQEYDAKRILDWVAKGNDLVYIDYCMYGSSRLILDKLDLKSSLAIPLEDAVLKTPSDLPEMQHVSQFVVSSETRLMGGSAILSDERGSLMVQVTHGKGRCLVATLPNLCSNRRISDKSNWGNFQFLINWLKSVHGRVLFDERVHGYTSAQNVFVYLARGPAGYVTLQLFIILLVALFSLNRRFGQAKLLSAKRKIATSEFIDGMALTYKKAKAFDTAFSILYSSFRTRLCKALALPPEEKPEEIARSWSQATSLSSAEALQFLENADAMLSSRNNTEEQLLVTMKECDRLYVISKEYLAVQPGRRLGG